MQDFRQGSGQGDDGQGLAEAVNEAMRPALDDMAREVVLAATWGNEPLTEDPEVLLRGIYELREAAETFWERFVQDVERMMDDHDPADTDDSMSVIEGVTETVRVLADRLSNVLAVA